jgi:hypothetical protein
MRQWLESRNSQNLEKILLLFIGLSKNEEIEMISIFLDSWLFTIFRLDWLDFEKKVKIKTR